MSRFVRARTAASETPRSAAIWVNGRRPSAWRCSMIRLSSGDTSSVAARQGARARRSGGQAHRVALGFAVAFGLAVGFGFGLAVGFGGVDAAGLAGGGVPAPGSVTIVRGTSGERSAIERRAQLLGRRELAGRPGSSGVGPVEIGPQRTRMLRPMNSIGASLIPGRSPGCPLGGGLRAVATDRYWPIDSGQPSYVASISLDRVVIRPAGVRGVGRDGQPGGAECRGRRHRP